MPKMKPKRKAVAKAQGKRRAAAKATSKPKSWWSAKRFARFVEQQEMRQAYCKYGHLGCSSRPGGACVNEILIQNPQLGQAQA